MKCDIVRDLLPLYIDGLASEASQQEIEEHLQQCEQCSGIYQQMKAPIEHTTVATPSKEIDYFKKIKKKNIKNVVMSIAIMIVIFGVLTSLFAVGTAVKKEDMTYTYSIESNVLWIHFKLDNGKKLLMRTQRTPLYNDKNEPIFDHVLYPCQIFTNPFDDVGETFDYGLDIGNYDETIKREEKIIIEFKDQRVVIEPQQVLKQIQ